MESGSTSKLAIAPMLQTLPEGQSPHYFTRSTMVVFAEYLRKCPNHPTEIHVPANNVQKWTRESEGPLLPD